MSSKRKKTDDPDENVFQVLKRYGVSLRSNIEVILNKLGFDSLNSLSELSKVPDYFKEMEESVATVLGDKEYCGNMSVEEKRALFGEFFAEKPEKFRFVLGDKCAIRSAVETANTLIVSAQKDYCYDDPYKKKKRRYNRKQTQGDYPVVDNAIKNDNDSDIHVVTLDAEESNLLNILLPRVTGVMESNQNITRVSNEASVSTSERQQVANQPYPRITFPNLIGLSIKGMAFNVSGVRVLRFLKLLLIQLAVGRHTHLLVICKNMLSMRVLVVQ